MFSVTVIFFCIFEQRNSRKKCENVAFFAHLFTQVPHYNMHTFTVFTMKKYEDMSCIEAIEKYV